MNNLSAQDYEKLWASGAMERKTMQKRRDYYDGYHAIVGQDALYTDGTTKSERVTNFVAYAVDLYVGSISGDSYNVTELEMTGDDADEAVNEGPQRYREIGTTNSFDTLDVENTRNAFIYGWGLETYEYHERAGIIVTGRDPINWFRVYNSDGELIGLINRSEIPAGGFMGEEQLEDTLEIMVVYTTDMIKTYHRMKGRNNGKWYTPEDMPDTRHFFNGVPAVVYRINESMSSHITDDVIGQQDEYNEIDSASGDDVKADSDGLLALKGFSRKDIQENAETIKQWKLLGLPQDGDAFYIMKNTNTNRVESRLERTRKHIFMGLSVPDIDEIVGATGATSGIALQLKFKPMADKAKYIIANLRSGIRERIDMINAIASRVGGRIDDVQINIAFSLPRNSVEEWTNVGALDGIVSHRKQLELLSDVTDPDQEETRLQREGEVARFDEGQSGTAEEIAARNDAVIAENAVKFQPQIATVIDSISDAALGETLRRMREGNQL